MKKDSLMDKVYIYCDGACSGNPGPGGWAYLMRYKHHEKSDSGCARHTTNNKMELQSLIEALKALKRKVEMIHVVSDSQYVVKGITEWRKSWESRSFRNVKNEDMWRMLYNLLNVKCERYTAEWIKAHNGHPENEMVDRMAVAAIQKCIK